MYLINLFTSVLSLLLMLLTLPGTLELLYLTAGAMFPQRPVRRSDDDKNPIRFCVVIPAHDEEDGIMATIHSVLSAHSGNDCVELVVVADNCSDKTASRAREASVRVLERNDLAQRGKGFALDFAFKRLMLENHDVYVVIDADTRIEPHFFKSIASHFRSGADGVQCAYRASNPEASVRARLMHIAWLAFNVLRPRGRQFWGQSVGLNGNGFALSRSALEAVPYEAGSIAEDLEYHLRLIESGRRLSFCGDTTVWSPVPISGKVAATQRSRWEGGRLRMIREQAPRLAMGFFQGKLSSLEPLFELLLLPLAYHVLLLLFLLVLPWAPGKWLAVLGLGTVALHVVVAMVLGRATWNDWLSLATAPFYILWKLMLGRKLLAASTKDAAWVRTERV